MTEVGGFYSTVLAPGIVTSRGILGLDFVRKRDHRDWVGVALRAGAHSGGGVTTVAPLAVGGGVNARDCSGRGAADGAGWSLMLGLKW